MKMKRILALLLAVVMIFSLAACGNDNAKGDDKDDKGGEKVDDRPLSEKIVGKWTTTIRMSGVKMQLPTFDGALEMKVEYTFNADGTGSAKLDVEAYEANVEANRKAIGEAFAQMLINQLGSRDAAENATKTQMNMTLAEYGDYAVDQLKTSMPDLNKDGEWSMEGDQLTMADEDGTITVSINGDTMTWTGDDLEENLGSKTVEFKRA